MVPTQWYPCGLHGSCMEQIFILYFELQSLGILPLLFFSLYFDIDSFLILFAPRNLNKKCFDLRQQYFQRKVVLTKISLLALTMTLILRQLNFSKSGRNHHHLLFLQFSLQRINQFKYLALEKKPKQLFWWTAFCLPGAAIFVPMSKLGEVRFTWPNEAV